ncbi:MAG: DNA repair protein RecN [Bacteroidota bacterium]
MLQRLTVRNFALICEVDLEFAPGLNLLTGETGAGKSLLVGAIGLILGRRADTSVLLKDDEKCLVEAVFNLPKHSAVRALLESEEIDVEDDQLIVRRIIQPSGKSRAFVNDLPVTLPILREISGRMVELHGQHEGQRLVDPEIQLELLDAYAGVQLERQAFGDQLAELRKLEREISALKKQAAEAREQEAFLRFQVEELDAAKLEPGEDEQLEQEFELLENAESVQQALAQVVQQLEHDEQQNLIAQLTGLERLLEPSAKLKPGIHAQLEALQNARYNLEEAARELERESESMELDPERLETVRTRLDVLNRLKTKYRVKTSDELIQKHTELDAQLQTISGAEARTEELEHSAAAARDSLVQLGLQLESARQAAAQELSDKILARLTAVGLPESQIELRIERLPASGAVLELPEGDAVGIESTGFNQLNFLISTNKGFAPQPLQKVASGGEISRVMLAVKSALAERLALEVLIFDEIDTGISGETAVKVGQEMEALAAQHQLITITHLPQIGARSGRHFFIRKEQGDEMAQTTITQLDTDGRIRALAEMLSGSNPTDTALNTARELLGETV